MASDQAIRDIVLQLMGHKPEGATDAQPMATMMVAPEVTPQQMVMLPTSQPQTSPWPALPRHRR